MDYNVIDRAFPGLDNVLLTIIKNRLDFFRESLKKSGLEIDLEPDFQTSLVRVLLFSEYISSSITRNPGILKDLVDSRDLFKSYSQQSYAVKIEKKIAKDMDVAAVKEILLQT